MSIHIIDSSTNYGDLQKNTLYLDATNDPHIIRIKSGLDNTYINYDEKYTIGLSNNDFVINNHIGKLASFNEQEIIFQRNVQMENDVNLSEKIIITDDGVSSYSNFSVILTGNEEFKINEHLKIDKDVININSNMFIRDATLYVNRISAINENDILTISGATFESGAVKSLVFQENATFDQTILQTDISPFVIKRLSSMNTDIIDISKTNGNGGETTPLFTLNKQGHIGIGTSEPTSMFSLINKNDNAMNFDGSNYGDKMILTNNGNLGLGVDNPLARLHIKRNDDYKGTHVRNHPILKMDMEYYEENNTSNIYNNITSDFLQIVPPAVNPDFYLINVDNPDLTSNIITKTEINNLVKEDSVIVYNTLLNNDNLDVATEINISQSQTLSVKLSVPLSSTDFVFKAFTYHYGSDDPKFYTTDVSVSRIKLNYFICPRTYYINKLTEFLVFQNDEENEIQKMFEHDVRDYSAPHQNMKNGPSFTKHDDIPVTLRTIETNEEIECDIVLYTHISDGFQVNYTNIITVVIPPPNFLQISKNDNTFISSLSANGTLSLGEQSPFDNFLFYNKGNAYIDTLYVDKITSPGNTVSFESKNAENIDGLKCTSLEAYSTFSTFSNSSNIQTSNISFETLSNTYLNFDENLLTFKTSSKIVTDNIESSEDFLMFERNNGLIVTNNSEGTNPSIVIDGVNNTPSMVIKNSKSLYSFNVKDFDFELGNLILQSSPTHNNYITNNYTPRVFKHYGQDDIISIGTQGNFNIRCSSDSTSAIDTTCVSIGVPWGNDYYNSGGNSKQDSVAYFKSDILTSGYTLNVFGNVRFANNTGQLVMEIKDGNVIIHGDLNVVGSFTNNP